MYTIKFILSCFIFLSACSGVSQTDRDSSANATYQVIFSPIWTSKNFPTNFPDNPHFSGLIGATHNGQVSFWSLGQISTPGIESVAETGNKTLFINEIQSKKDNNTAEFLLSGDGLSTGTGSVILEFDINKTHSLVTLISMIAPSPDWFVGVHDLNLFDRNQWRQEVIKNLVLYDAGTDSGKRFNSFNSNFRGVISKLRSLVTDTDFFNGIHRRTHKTIARFSFIRIK